METRLIYNSKMSGVKIDNAIEADVFRHHFTGYKSIYLRSEVGICTLCIPDNSVIALIYDLLVAPEHRGNGYGQGILSAALDIAKEEGAIKAVLFPDCEPWVVDWYERNGFVKDEAIPKMNNIHDGYVKTL